MSLFDARLAECRRWVKIGDTYEITKKPRALDTSSLEAVPFVPMAAIPQGGAYAPDFTLKAPAQIRSSTYFERGDILVAKITPSFENGKQALATEVPTPFGSRLRKLFHFGRAIVDMIDDSCSFTYCTHTSATTLPNVWKVRQGDNACLRRCFSIFLSPSLNQKNNVPYLMRWRLSRTLSRPRQNPQR